MKKILVCFVALALSAVYIQAQSDMDPINTGAANFLLIPTDAQSAAMGGTGVGLLGKDNAIFYNGATAMFDDNRIGGVTYTYSPWMRDYESGYSLHTVGAFYKMDNHNALLIGFRYYGYPKVNGLEDTSQKDIRPSEMSFELGYACELLPELAVSATAKTIRSDMGNINDAKVAYAVAFDIGALYKKNISVIPDAYWTAGLQVSNLGTKVQYLKTKESLPAMVKVGGSVDLPFSRIHRLIVAADGGYRMMPSDVTVFDVGVGAEYILMDHFMLRGGYHYGDKKKGNHSYASAGAGINYFGIHVDFAWLFAEKSSPIRNSFLISAVFHLSKL